MDKNDKIAAFIGFALKAGGCVLGSEAVARCRKKIFVLLLARNAAPNTAKDILLKAERLKIPLIVPRNADLSDLVHKQNCKTAGITHKELANSILENLNENYTLSGGVN